MEHWAQSWQSCFSHESIILDPLGHFDMGISHPFNSWASSGLDPNSDTSDPLLISVFIWTKFSSGLFLDFNTLDPFLVSVLAHTWPSTGLNIVSDTSDPFLVSVLNLDSILFWSLSWLQHLRLSSCLTLDSDWTLLRSWSCLGHLSICLELDSVLFWSLSWLQHFRPSSCLGLDSDLTRIWSRSWLGHLVQTLF